MSLPILIVVVFAGISLIVLAVHFSGGSAVAKVDDPELARLRFAVDFEEETTRDVFIARDRETAFLLLDSKGLGIVHSVGDRFLTRLLQRSEIRGVAQPEKAAIELKLDDITWPGGRFSFDDEQAAVAVLQHLGMTPESKKESA
jgi:hypothetical protein